VTIGIVGASVELLGHPLGLLPYLAIAPFEIIVGLYLLTQRIPIRSTAQASEPVTV